MAARLRAWLPARRSELLLALVLLSSYGYFYPSLGHNEAARLDLTRAIVEDGALRVDRFRYNSADLVVHGGRTYSNKAPLTSLLAVPGFALARFLVARAAPPEWAYWDAVAALTTLSSVGLLSALAAVYSFRVIRRATNDAAAAALAVVAVWLGTILFPFSTLLFGHAVAAAFVALAFGLLFEARHGGARDWPRYGLAGLASGAAVATEYPAALVVGLLALYALASWRWRAVLAHAAGLGAGLALAALYNLAAFGQLFFAPYQAYVEEGSRAAFRAHSLGYLGVHWPGLAAFAQVLGEITLAPQRGILYCNPILWLALPGLALLALRPALRGEAALIAAASVAMLAFNACYGDSIVYWGGGASIGPRHLIPLLPLLALPLALAARRLPWLFAPLLLVSLFAMLVATAVEPRVPYEYGDPFRDFLLPHYARGRLALMRGALFDPGGRWLASDAGASNLGRLAGLAAPLQLVPWACLSWLAGRALIVSVAPAARAARALLPVALGAALLPPLLGASPAASGRGLVAEYFRNAAWAGAPVEIRQEAPLAFAWLAEPAWPPPASARWQGALRVTRPGTYLLRVEGDDHAFLQLDGRQVAEADAARSMPVAVELAAGIHALSVRFYNRDGAARLRLFWTPPGGREEIVPAARLGP